MTLAHYSARAEDFRAGTADHDVSQNIEALLRSIEATAPYEILDLGCGPGRDLAQFVARGHHATGLDGCAEFVAMARAAVDCPVWQQDLFNLELPEAAFDGIFANAVLFHVPSASIVEVLKRLHATLRARGVLFCSNPRGNNEEGWNRGRYGAYHDLSHWSEIMIEAGFEEIEHYYRPHGLPREEQPWLASVWRRLETASA